MRNILSIVKVICDDTKSSESIQVLQGKYSASEKTSFVKNFILVDNNVQQRPEFIVEQP